MTGRTPDALIAGLAACLDEPGSPRTAERLGRLVLAAGAAFRPAVIRQGLGPHLFGIAGGPHGAAIDEATVAWLIAEQARNAARIARMHEELAAILGAAAAAGIRVMPLKGSLLSTRPGTDPARRPMADLDLLVRPENATGLAAVLERHGYRREPDGSRRPSHAVFLDPSSGGTIASAEGEHPDNPRRVELHVEVRRHLWGWTRDDEVTGLLWRDAVDGAVLGQPAAVPSPSALFAHLAVHAACDLLVGRGRLVQWLDLAETATDAGPDTGRQPHDRLTWLSTTLAGRAMPVGMTPLAGRVAAARVPPALRRWADRVPLDSRCGLTAGRGPAEAATWGARWERWAPRPWRLAVAWGALPLPVGLARHALMLSGVGRRALVRRRARVRRRHP